MPMFSIIIPVYNAKSYLDECVQSVLNQTFRDFELLLVNDGSGDDSGRMCDRWAAQDRRVVALHKENGGSASARNMGIDAAVGEYLLFMDSDDYWISCDVLQRLADRLRETKPDVLVYNLQKEFNGVREKPYFPETASVSPGLTPEETAEQMVGQNLWTACAWNKAVRACFFTEGRLRFLLGNTSEDIDWSLRLALAVRHFDYVDVCAVSYRQRTDSITGSMTGKKVRQLLENVKICRQLLEEHPEQGRLWRPYVAYQYGTLVYNIAMLNGDEAKGLRSEAKAMSYILKWSDESKIKLLRRVKSLVGFSLMLRLLRVRGKRSYSRMRRGD